MIDILISASFEKSHWFFSLLLLNRESIDIRLLSGRKSEDKEQCEGTHLDLEGHITSECDARRRQKSSFTTLKS